MRGITDDPKEHLLTTAERLFAEYGLEAVSARQIALAAGHRNQSAIHYHFGTKEALIHALRARRVQEINERRRVILEEMVHDKRINNLRALIEALILPLAQKVDQTPNGGNYARFLAHLFADRRRRDLWMEKSEETALLRRVYRLMRRQTSWVPEPLWSERLRFVVGGMINALADRERMRAAEDPTWRKLPEPVFVHHLVDAALAILTAPVSALVLEQTADHENRTMEGERKCWKQQKPL